MSNDNYIDFPAVVKEQVRDGKRRKKEESAKAKEQRRKRTKIKFYFISFVVTTMVISIAWFFDNYQLRNPILLGFQAPYVRRNEAVNILSPVAEAKTPSIKTDMEVIEQYKLSTVLKGVYTLESSRGKNDGCKDKGQFNGFGFRQNSSEFKCYESFDTVVERVNEWYEERLAYNGNNLSEALCYYNEGIAGQDACKYSIDFMKVIVDVL